MCPVYTTDVYISPPLVLKLSGLVSCAYRMGGAKYDISKNLLTDM
jgi:hypothetical protein